MASYKDKGIKMTPQRMAILQFLDGNRNHPSAEDIYSGIKHKYPMMSFATVYKTIEMLKKHGYLLELTIDPQRRRYDPDTSRHHHLICIHCRKIIDIFGNFPVNIPEDDQGSFEMIGNHIEFYGICPECKKERRS